MVSINSKKIDSILVFEYYTASGINDPKIISEAVALIESLLNDLSSFSANNSLDIHFLISKDFSDIGDSYGFSENAKIKDNIAGNKIVIDTSLEDWLEKNASNFDGCIFISAEENMNLYNLTKILEDNNVKIYGSDSNSTLLCSNKYSTFEHLKGVVNQPKTFKFTVCDESPWEISIKTILEFLEPIDSYKKDNFPKDDFHMQSDFSRDDFSRDDFSKDDFHNQNDFKLIVKPLYGVDCQDMFIISNEEDIAKISEIYPENSEIVVQEFIYGENLSVSLISDGITAIPLTLNKQYLEINKENQQYFGGELPFNHPLKDMIFSIAKKAVESIDGIKGFVGVDLILKDSKGLDNLDNYKNFQEDIYFLEINSRFTTPYVGLSKIAKFNIGKTIIEILDGKLLIDELNGNDYNLDNNYVKFIKNGNDLDIEVL